MLLDAGDQQGVTMTEERIAPVGYINDKCEHALISIYNPALLNPSSASVQVAISIDGAITLRAALNAFLRDHGVVEH